MRDKTVGERLAEAMARAKAERAKEQRRFTESDKNMTARREGRVMGCPPPANADLGMYQAMKQQIGISKGLLFKDHKGRYQYGPEETPKKERPAEKLVKGKIKRKRYPSITM